MSKNDQITLFDISGYTFNKIDKLVWEIFRKESKSKKLFIRKSIQISSWGLSTT